MGSPAGSRRSSTISLSASEMNRLRRAVEAEKKEDSGALGGGDVSPRARHLSLKDDELPVVKTLISEVTNIEQKLIEEG